MIAADTNVLVRFLVRDHAAQAARAAALIQGNRIWIAKTVLLETEWVLRSLYAFAPDEIAAALLGLAGLPMIEIEDEMAVARALGWMKQGIDFADALHLASSTGAKLFATFDRKFAAAAGRLKVLEMLVLG